MSSIPNDINQVIKPKKKRGRKSKAELERIRKEKEAGTYVDDTPKKKPGRRGRKPKGGKIVNITPANIIKKNDAFKNIVENIIIQFKCTMDDYNFKHNIMTNEIKYTPEIHSIKAYDETNENDFSTQYYKISNDNHTEIKSDITKNKTNIIIKPPIRNNKIVETQSHINSVNDTNKLNEIWDKIKILQKQLYFDNINQKCSDCFWCTCKFDTPPIYIPKHKLNNSYKVYGNFCSPECACAFLFNEPVTSSVKWERYALLNSVYSSIYKYNNNIKPAPEPYYLLDKYFGNISIEEYRKLLDSSNLLLVIDKPLTRVLPEIYLDNDHTNDSNNGNNQKNKYNLSRNK
jgi:hypothetical protein